MTRSLCQRWLTFLGVVGFLAALWTIVLPWAGQLPPVRARIEFLDSQGIDPSALYYTDLEAMPRLEANLAAKRRQASRAFWVPDGL